MNETLENVLGVMVAIAVVVGLFCIGWGITHAILEFGQYLFESSGWTWEPTMWHSFFIHLALGLIGGGSR